MFNFRVPFLLSIIFCVIFAKFVHGNGTEVEPSTSLGAVDDSLAFGILMNGTFADDVQLSNRNSTNAKNADDVESLAKTIMQMFLCSIKSMVRFFGDIITKVTRSLGDAHPHKNGFLVNGTENEPQQQTPEGAEEVNVPNEANGGNGTATGVAD